MPILKISGAIEALEQYSAKLDREILKQQMEETSNDPLFMSDLEDSMTAFEAVDREATKESGNGDDAVGDILGKWTRLTKALLEGSDI